MKATHIFRVSSALIFFVFLYHLVVRWFPYDSAPHIPTPDPSHAPVTLQCDPNAIVPSIQLSTNWYSLGPFQIGTREAEWGADPLEYFGGFENLVYNRTESFKSSLSTNGTVRWRSLSDNPSSLGGSRIVTVSFDSPVVDWNFLRSVYGWAGIQYQAWIRGTLVVCPGLSRSTDLIPVTLNISPTLEFFVNKEKYFGGDMFSYRRAPTILYLEPGTQHTLDIRIAHDIRVSGGGIPPTVDIVVEAEIAIGGLVVNPGDSIVPDIVGGKLAGAGWGSIPVRNENFVDWVEVLGVMATDAEDAPPTIVFNEGKQTMFRVAPGQSRPLKFRITDHPSNSTKVSLLIQYRVEARASPIFKISTVLTFTKVDSVYNPHIFTFIHPSNIVSFAALRAPSLNATCKYSPVTKLPVLLNLHGSGVDVHWRSAQNVYEAIPNLCAWLLFPQGVTLWGGDDWHIWGWAGAEAAVASIPEWIKSMGWEGLDVDLDRWVVSGHSNGGQGTWYALTHRSDRIIAATPLSGYLSIPAYVPYHMWHEMDSKKASLILAAMNSYSHELLVGNIVGTPIRQGHGQLDENVPIFHSRRIQLLSEEAGWETEYTEYPGRGHWWEGVMTYRDLLPFLDYYVNTHPEIPPLPPRFTISVANPADMGSRGGVMVDQLHVNDQLGKIDIQRLNKTTWKMHTTNIRRWHFEGERVGVVRPSVILLDDQQFSLLDANGGFMNSVSGVWMRVHDTVWRKKERSGRQLGALNAFLNTKAHFTIVLPPFHRRRSYHLKLAVELANNLYKYFAAESAIVEDYRPSAILDGNAVFLGHYDAASLGQFAAKFPIKITDKAISLRDTRGRGTTFRESPGIGSIFIHPLGEERLALVILGLDEDGLRAAIRLVPLRTGVGQPDFVILGREAAWKGTEGVLAMGQFDSDWQISTAFF